MENGAALDAAPFWHAAAATERKRLQAVFSGTGAHPGVPREMRSKCGLPDLHARANMRAPKYGIISNVMNIVILLGAPGSGKGTVAGKLAAGDSRLKHVSSGDLLRGAIAAGTQAGIEAKGYMEKGELVPDALIAAMIKDVVAAGDAGSTMLLDGFPRNLAQAGILDGIGANVRAAVLIDVPDEIIHDRIAGRRLCPKCKAGYHVRNFPPKVEGVCDNCGEKLVVRKDDNPETVRDRLEVYHRQTEPLVAYYRDKGILNTLDGMAGLDNIVEAFGKLLAGL